MKLTGGSYGTIEDGAVGGVGGGIDVRLGCGLGVRLVCAVRPNLTALVDHCSQLVTDRAALTKVANDDRR